MKYPGRPCEWSVIMLMSQRRKKETDIIVARSHEGVVAEIATDICLNHFSADSISRDKVLILATGHNVVLRLKVPGSKGLASPTANKEMRRIRADLWSLAKKRVDGGVSGILDSTVWFSIRRPAQKIQGSLVTTSMTIVFGLVRALGNSRIENDSPRDDGQRF